MLAYRGLSTTILLCQSDISALSFTPICRSSGIRNIPNFLKKTGFTRRSPRSIFRSFSSFRTCTRPGVSPRLAMNVSPPLCEMLADELLQERYTRASRKSARAGQKGTCTAPNRGSRVSRRGADVCRKSFGVARSLERPLRSQSDQRFSRTAGRRRDRDHHLRRDARLSAADLDDESRRAQVRIAVANYKKHFGRQPRGIWLPECAYEPGIEDLLERRRHRVFHFATRTRYFTAIRGRDTASTLRSCARTASPFSRATSRQASRFGAPRSAIRAMTSTANFTAISAGTLRSTI